MLEESKNTSLEDGRYKTLFESVNAAAFLTGINGKILESNQKSCWLFGYDWDDLTKMNISDIFPETADWPQISEEIFSKGGMNFESENVRKDGTSFPVSISTSLFKIDGKPIMLALIWDITERKEAEKKLKASEERYRSIFNNSAVAIMLTDEHERIVSWNKYTETLLDMGEDELRNKLITMFYPPDELEKIRVKNIGEKGVQQNLETRMYKKNNELIDVDLSLSMFKNDTGEITGSIAVIKDITERKQAEKKLKESEQKYEGLFESTTDGMLVLDARGEILNVNNRALELFGLKEEDMIRKNLLSMDLLTQKSLSIIVSQFKELLAQKNAISQETEIVDQDGKILAVELSSFFLIKKENEVDNFILVIRDISDRKQAEIKLSHEHELLQTLMDSIPDSIYFKDDKNRFIMVNKAKAAHFNVEAEEMIGKTDFDFLPENEARKTFEDDEEALRAGKYIIDKIEKLTDIDGNERWISVTKIPRFDTEGNIVGTMGISRDITKWKRLEEEYKKEATN